MQRSSSRPQTRDSFRTKSTGKATESVVASGAVKAPANDRPISCFLVSLRGLASSEDRKKIFRRGVDRPESRDNIRDPSTRKRVDETIGDDEDVDRGTRETRLHL